MSLIQDLRKELATGFKNLSAYTIRPLKHITRAVSIWNQLGTNLLNFRILTLPILHRT